MTSVANHYETLLAPIYLWMAGGPDEAFAAGTADISEFLHVSGTAVDLGAGFGMHSVPLARAGYKVLAIDTSAYLLEQLRQHSLGMPVKAVQADLRDFARQTCGPVDLILCMGDTLTHLDSTAEVALLLRAVAASLCPGGQFMATFRDYRALPAGERRFIPVRSDEHRIHTCFLEELAECVIVHDIVHEFRDNSWSQKVSSYRKLRLAPEAVVQAAERAGLVCVKRPGPRGMLTIVAHS